MSKDSSHITLFTLPELNPLPHHVSSLPRTTKYTAILREKVWRALSRAAGFFLHQETSGVRCLGACPLTHPRIQVSAGCCPSSVQCNTARSRSLLNLSCLAGIVAYHWVHRRRWGKRLVFKDQICRCPSLEASTWLIDHKNCYRII